MENREIIQKLVDIDVEEGQVLVQALVTGLEGQPVWCWVKDVELAVYHDSDGASKVAVLICEKVKP